MLTASAASPVIARRLGAMAQRLAPDGAAAAPPVEDVVPADSDDPRGTGFGALALPLIMSAPAAAVLLTLAIPAAAWRAAGVPGKRPDVIVSPSRPDISL